MVAEELKELLSNASKIKPKDLSINDLKWKYLIWAAVKRKNILLIGPTRCGKTTAIQKVAQAIGAPFFEFDLGGTQDARATLVGNTVFKKETGTVFHPCEFVSAIQTPGAVILLDELTRCSHDGWNILMPVLDKTRRCLRLDEKEDSAVVKVNDVCFAATANIGSEYTATKTLDRALGARFTVKVEMPPLEKKDLLDLVKVRFPKLDTSDKSIIYNLCEIADKTIKELKKDEPKSNTIIPTGTVLEMAELTEAGFQLEEIAEVAIYPDYPEDQGVDSERTYIKQMVEGYGPKKDAKNPLRDPIKPKS